MSATLVGTDSRAGTVGTVGTSACRLCPPRGGVVVATYAGDGPPHRAEHRAEEEAAATGLPHHDHYDPSLDAFVVIRHQE